MTAERTPSWDPLGYSTELGLRRRLYPLGFALDLWTNHRDVVEAADESWAGCNQTFDKDPLELRVAVTDGPSELDPAAPTFRGQGHLLVLAADAHNFASCDLERSIAACWLSSSVAHQRAFLRYHYLEAIVHTLLSYRHLTPIHASCVAASGQGVLLSGPPGSGKSCLAFACAKAGLTFVSDDVSYLLRNGDDRTVLGRPQYIRLQPGTRTLFPELATHPDSFDIDGQPMMEVQTGKLPNIAATNRCQADHVIFLQRTQSGGPRLSRIDRDTALTRLTQELPRLDADVNHSQLLSLERLVKKGAYVLAYSELPSAVDQIRRLLEKGREE